MENAIIDGLRNKEKNNGVLSVTVSKTDRHIVYSISDNGIGRVAAKSGDNGKGRSYGTQMSCDHIRLFNKEAFPSVQITDLYLDEKIAGTNVEVRLNIV